MKKTVAVLLVASLSFGGLAAEDTDAAVKDAIASLEAGIGLLKAGTLEEAAEEIRWGLELVDQALQSGIDKLLADQVDLGGSGVFVGGEIFKNKMMGAVITERIYESAAGSEIKVTLTRWSADGGGGFMAGVGSLAKLGLMQGERVRVGGIMGSAMDDGGEKTVMLPLDDGSLLNISSVNERLDVVKAFSQAYPVRELNAAASRK